MCVHPAQRVKPREGLGVEHYLCLVSSWGSNRQQQNKTQHSTIQTQDAPARWQLKDVCSSGGGDSWSCRTGRTGRERADWLVLACLWREALSFSPAGKCPQ